jgi:ATP-dependent 26S proteasome regulatory subunit
MLVNAIATMTGAQIFNLTPKNTAEQYVGKSNVTKMVHMAFKVGRAHCPAIIYIDNIEMVFAKKVPKDDTTDPKRIKKDLLKSLKGLSPSDRVIFIGTSYKPWEADVKALVPIFDKHIYVPKPDYASRNLLWKEFLCQKMTLEQTSLIDFSALTRLSQGLTSGAIKLICDRVLTERRLRNVKRFLSNPIVK